MPKPRYKAPPKIRQAILEYVLVALVALPFMIGVGILCWLNSIPTILTMFFYGAIFLTFWLIWLIIKNKIIKRQKEIRARKRATRSGGMAGNPPNKQKAKTAKEEKNGTGENSAP